MHALQAGIARELGSSWRTHAPAYLGVEWTSGQAARSDAYETTTRGGATRRRPTARTTSARTSSSAWAKPPSSNCTPTASPPCRPARKCWCGISSRRLWPGAISTSTSGTSTTSRCASCSRRSSRGGRDPRPTAPAMPSSLHEAVLDQHRALQQPDGAEVRAGVQCRRVCGGRARRRRRRGRRCPRARGNRSTRCWRGDAPLLRSTRSTRW